MSLKPGIGAHWFLKYHSDVYPRDEVILRGRSLRPPKYYDKLYTRLPDGEFALEMVIQSNRMQKALLTLDCDPLTLSGWERLQVKKTVAEARLSQFKKTL